jgi:hypothetical protein
MSKFLLNLLLQIFKTLVNSKIQFLIHKFFFLTFGPADLAAHSAFGPASPLPSLPCRLKPPRPTHLARASVASSREYVFPFGSRLPSWPPLLSSLCQVGPNCQFRLPPALANRCRFLPSPPATPRHPTSDPEMPGKVFTPHLDSPP